MSARGVAALAALVLLGAAAVVCAAAALSILAMRDMFLPVSMLMASVILVVPAALLAVGVLVRRRRRLAWTLLLAGTSGAAMALALGWSSNWPLLPAATASTVDFTGTDARPVDVATGSTHACALLDDGTVWCWGSNLGGQLGSWEYETEPPMSMSATPVRVPGLTGATAIAAAGLSTCAIDQGRLVCWGGSPPWHDCQWQDGSPQCSLVDTAIPGPVLGGTGETTLDAAVGATCWQGMTDGAVGCPGGPSSVSGVSTIALGDMHGCIVADGRVYCWGTNLAGELGSGAVPARTPNDGPEPRWGNPVTGIETARTVAVGTDATCAGIRDANGGPDELRCWGRAAYDAFGLQAAGDPGEPFVVPGGVDPPRFPVDPWPLCLDPATAPPGCDKYTRTDQLESMWMATTEAPEDLGGPVADTGSGFGTCAVVTGRAMCWGLMFGMEAGGPRVSEPLTIRPLEGLDGISRIATSTFSSCAIAGGRVRCWGLGASGQLGLPYPFGAADLAVPIGLLALVVVAMAAAYGTLGIYQVDTRRKAALAGVTAGTLDLGRWSLVRLAVFVLASLAILVWRINEDNNASLGHGPGIVLVACLAGGFLAAVRAVPASGWKATALRVIGACAIAGALALAGSWLVADLWPVVAGRLPQPTAAGWLLEGATIVPFLFLPLVAFLVPPMDPILARDFREEFRRARTPRRRASLVLHPWRVVAAQATETERRRLASELHAEVLPGLYRSLEAAEDGGSVERLAQDLREAVEEVEGMLTRRRSIVLEEIGLLAALEWLAERTEERSDVTIEIDVEATGEPGDSGRRPPRFVERAAFRVAQLALENVTRHAPGASVAVHLAIVPDAVRMTISDDGPGLGRTPADAARAGCKGLADMDEEARACGAALVVSSPSPRIEGCGVVVDFTWTA